MKAEIKVAQGDNLSTHEYLRTGWSCVRVCLIVRMASYRFPPIISLITVVNGGLSDFKNEGEC